MTAAGDALGELAQLAAREQLAQLRLADEDDLQELLRVGFEVGQEADLLEDLGGEVLRLIDHQHHALAVGMGVQQVAAEDIDQVLQACARGVRHADAELLADREEQLGRRHARIEDERDLGVFRDLRQERAHERGLAGADLPGELHEAAGFVDAVQQMRERLGVPLAEEQVARIGSDREGLFVEAEEAEVHGALPRGCSRAAASVPRSAPAPHRAPRSAARRAAIPRTGRAGPPA